TGMEQGENSLAFQIINPLPLRRLVFATDFVSPANDAIGRAVGKQPLGPFRESRERGYPVTGFRPRSFNGFQHDACAVFRRGFGLCAGACGVCLLISVNATVRWVFEYFLICL